MAQSPAMLSDQTIGSYRIQDKLGQGGMGEVYLATDVRLKRQVAIKVLPASLATDPDRLARFQREAEVVASLNHPNIAGVYGLEEAGGVKALVMELVEGPTLADRIAQGPLPLEEALPIARQIADALEAAHSRGIIHRDLKPANIKVRHDGTVKVLDFGLAKLTETAAAERSAISDPAMSPTITSPAAVTGIGMIMGTAAYMSPEQARGRPVDKRTDVFAFGAVLYEMLAGKRAFEGEDITDTMASVVKTTPAWEALPPSVPPHIVSLIQRCLDKDRNTRVGDLSVARYLLAGNETVVAVPPSVSHTALAVPARRWTTAAVAAATIAALVVGAAIAWLFSPGASDSVPAAATHLQLDVQPADSLVGSIAAVRPSRTSMAISPDGRLVVFAGVRGNSGPQLYARRLEETDATPIAGTDGAANPFFSPDGASIGFWADSKIKKVPVGGGPAATVCDMPGTTSGTRRALGASWGPKGTILFAGINGIFTVPAAGGTPQQITKPDQTKGDRHLLPHWLPDGEAFLFTTAPGFDWETATISVQTISDNKSEVLITGGADGRYTSSGHLLFIDRGTLKAAPFNARSRRLSGETVALVENVMQGINAPNGADETGAGQFAVSDSGTLIYVLGGAGPILEHVITWIDRRSGTIEPFSVGAPGPYLNVRFSPDGRRVVSAVRRGASRNTDLWVYDVERGAPTRLTSTGDNGTPLWDPGSTRIVFAGLRVINGDGSGKPDVLLQGATGAPSSWSKTAGIAYLQRTESGASGIWVLPMENGQPQTPKLFLESNFTLSYPEFSPDGRYLAYISNESGTNELYVQSYPDGGQKTRVSASGASEPIWLANGREILYRTARDDRQQIHSVAVRSTTPFAADPARVVHDVKCCEYDGTTPTRSWDATADGQRFLVRKRIEPKDKPVAAMHIVLNWYQELTRLAPLK